MKKIVLVFVCVLIACMASRAQGVKFESGTWDEILTKAKSENKTIFVDVYTQWCGPCKHVAENVFPQKKMGDLYNSLFINFKVDAETPAGKEFIKTYPVQGYPTFFFIDGNGKVIRDILGARDLDGFISEAKIIDMYARHGGLENTMAIIKNGTADRELLYDYYTLASKEDKPTALNYYLNALPMDELIDVDNKLIDEISIYDKKLMNRLAEGIVQFSHGEKFADGEFVGRYAFDIVFPVQYNISTFLSESIEEGNLEWFNELLELKEKFKGYTEVLLDGDLNVQTGRGLFFATPEYIKLCYWSKNRTNEKGFKNALTTYMDKFIRENHVDSLMKEEQNISLKMIKQVETGVSFFTETLLNEGNMTTRNIIEWTRYFWKLSPSNKKTKKLCTQWINYAYNLNRFNARVAILAANALARIGNFDDAKIIMEKAIASQKDIYNEDPKLLRDLEVKLQDINNRKF